MVKEIKNIEDFKNAVDGDKNVVVIDFYADWCGPCKMFAPKFENMSKKYPGVGFYKINSDNEETAKICDACNIRSLPTFCFFTGGKYTDQIIGPNELAIEKMIQTLNQTKNSSESVSAPRY